MKLNVIELYKLKKVYSHFFPKFVVVGGINTVVSYGVYFLLTKITTFRIAYLVAFISGIFFSYLLNLMYVFESKHTLKKAKLFLLLYLGQFILGFFALNFLVVLIKVNPLLTPFIVALTIMPVTYLFTKFLLKGNAAKTATI